MSLPVGAKRLSLTYDSDGNITPDVHLKKNVGYESVYELARIIDLVKDNQYDHVIFVGNVERKNILWSYEGEEGEDSEEILGYITNPNPSLYDAYKTAKTRYGTPSETNRIAIVILSSVIEETATIGLNSKYIDIISLGESHLINNTTDYPAFEICGNCDGAKIKGLTITSRKAPILNVVQAPFTGTFSFVSCKFYSTPKSWDESNYSNYAQFVIGVTGNGVLDFDQCHFYPSTSVFKSLRTHDVQPDVGSAYTYDVVVRNSTIHCSGILRAVLLQKYFTLKFYNSIIEMTNKNFYLFTNESSSTDGTLAKLISNKLTITAPSQGEYFYFNGTSETMKNPAVPVTSTFPVESFYVDISGLDSEADSIMEVFKASSQITGRICNVTLSSEVRRQRPSKIYNVMFHIRALNSTLRRFVVSRFDGILKLRAFELERTVRLSDVSNYEIPRAFTITAGTASMITTTGCAAPVVIDCNIQGKIYEPYSVEGSTITILKSGGGYVEKNSLGFFSGSIYGGSSSGVDRCVSISNPLRQCMIKNHTFFKRELDELERGVGNDTDPIIQTWWPDVVLSDKYIDYHSSQIGYRGYVVSVAPVLIQGCSCDGILRVEYLDPSQGPILQDMSATSSRMTVIVTNSTFTSRTGDGPSDENDQAILPGCVDVLNNKEKVILSSVVVVRNYRLGEAISTAPSSMIYNTFDHDVASTSRW